MSTSTAVSAEIFAMSMQKTFEMLKKAKTGLFSSGVNLSVVTQFIINALDEAIKYAQLNMTDGAEKKAFVMLVISRLYDTTVGANLPYWLYPFASSVKNVIINVIVSNAIDWIVQKYKDGQWSVQNKV